MGTLKIFILPLVLWHFVAFGRSETLKYALSSQPLSFDPAATQDAESLNASENIFEGLLRYKPGTLEIEPCLAKKWTVSSDGKKYQFTLRRGVRFHDGTPFNANAVVFSLLRQHDRTHEAHGHVRVWDAWHSVGAASLIRQIKSLDEHTVEIEIKEARSSFLYNFAMAYTSIVSPTAVRKLKDEFSFHPVGTGPYRFVRNTRNENILLERFESYWGKAAQVQRVLYKIMPESALRLNAFLKGDIHILNAPTPEQASLAEKQIRARIVTVPSLNVSYLAFNTQKGPFRDKRVRQALSHAFDKETFVKATFRNFADVAVAPMPPSVFGYNFGLKNYPFDLTKARELLLQSEFKKGFKTSLYFPNVPKPSVPNGKQMAEIIKEYFRKLDVDVELQTFEWGTYLNRVKNGEHEMVLLGWTGDNADPQNFLYYLLSSSNAVPPATNVAFFKNTEFDSLLTKAEKEMNDARRKKLYEKAQEIFREEAPWIPLAHVKPVVLLRREVDGFVPGPDGSRRFDNVRFINAN